MEETFQRHIFALIIRGADDEKTHRRSAKRNKSPEDVHLLDRRVFRSSQVVHSERAQCELHDNGPVVPIGNHSQDAPSVRFGGRDDDHSQDVDLRAAAARGAVARSTNVGSRSSSLATSTRCQTLRGGDPAADGDVFPFRACCSWLRFFRGGAQTTRTGAAVRSSSKRKRWRRAHTGDEEGASTSSCPGATQVVPRTARDIPDFSCARARTPGVQTTEPRHHNGEFVNEIRVSPIDEVSATSKRTNCDVRHDDPGLEPTDLLHGHAKQHEVGVVEVKTAVTVYHVGTSPTSSWEHLGSISCQKKCIKKCHCVNPGRTTLHGSQKLSAKR